MPEIMLEVRNKTPTVIREQECIVADNSDYTMHFSFDDDWLPTAKTVFFVLDNGYAFEPRETVDDSVNVPLIKTDCARFLFVGLRQGDVKTTLPCSIRVLLSIAAKINDDAVQPDPSMWESVLKRLARLEAGGGTGGLSPVDKTDAMTAEVGRDEDGRLWTAGTRRGVSGFGLGIARGPDGFGEFPALNIAREDGLGFSVLLKDIAEQIKPDLSDGLPEHTAADEGKFMRIINGAPVWSTVINGEEVKF